MAFKVFLKSEEHDLIMNYSMMHKKYSKNSKKKETFWVKTRLSEIYFNKHEQKPQTDLNSVFAVHKPDKRTTML